MIPKICIIGNNASGKNLTDGGRIKIRLYNNILQRANAQVFLIDLDCWRKRFFNLIFQISNQMKKCDTILIMAGPNGCRIIIPLVVFLNRRFKKRLVFCPLGIGTLDFLLKNMSHSAISNFLNCEDFYGLRDERMGRMLSKMDAIIPQNELLTAVYKNFYKLNNCYTVPNFRDVQIIKRTYLNTYEDNSFKIIFLSRVSIEKGIFTLIEAVKKLNAKNNGIKYILDIYGGIQLSSEDSSLLGSLQDKEIRYLGELSQNEVMDKMSKYNLFCLPTKYHGEGTPGVLIESFFVGTPALISSYSQAHHIIKDMVDGFIFMIDDVNDLEEKILLCSKNPDLMEKVSSNSQLLAQKYTFEYNKGIFLKYVIGNK